MGSDCVVEYNVVVIYLVLFVSFVEYNVVVIYLVLFVSYLVLLSVVITLQYFTIYHVHFVFLVAKHMYVRMTPARYIKPCQQNDTT